MKKIALVLLVLLALAGCSEKPAGTLVWKQDHMTIKTALSGVTLLPSRQLIATGYQLPEFSLVARPLSLVFGPSGWTELPMPAPPSGSAALYGIAVDPAGRAWTVGRTVASEAEPFDPTPLVYKLEAGAWSQESLGGLGSLTGLTLNGVATGGSPSAPEVRAVGDSASTAGKVLRWIGGSWQFMTLPSRSGNWTLRAIAHSVDGTWYAVGAQSGQVGGTILVDRGQGWVAMDTPPMEVEWTGVACDGRGVPYIAGNIPQNGETQGVLCRLHHGMWEDVPITRRTSDEAHLYFIAFDGEGNGWAVGGRATGGPFLVGYTPSGWTETPLEAEAEAHPDNEQVSGGDLTGVVVDGELNAVSVGSALETGPEGESEYQPRVFRLGFRRAGEVDSPSRLSP